MIITGAPSKFHAAFNPIIFEVTQSSDTEASAALPIYDENGILVATLTRTFYDTTTKFDVSNVVNKMFSTSEPIFIAGVAVDKRLFVKYKVGGVWYIAINAAIDMGRTSSLAGQVGLILSKFSKVTVYANYPFDISVLVDAAFSGLTAESVNRIQDAANFVQNTSNVVYLLDNSGDYILDNLLNYIILDRTGGSATGSLFVVENGCIPPNPFYVRWVNNSGGLDYWMFSVSQDVKTSLKSSSSFRKFYTDTEAERGSSVSYAKEAEDIVTAGSVDLTSEQYQALSAIPFSPMIEWFNEDIQKWVRLSIDKEDNTQITRQTRQTIEITFILPQRNLQ